MIEMPESEFIGAPTDTEQTYRMLVEGTKAIHWRIDIASGRVTFMSKKAEEALGYPADSWTDIDVLIRRIHPQDRDKVVKFCADAVGRGVDPELTFRVVTRTGQEKWIRIVASVSMVEGRPATLTGFWLDVTDFEKAQEQRRMLLGKVISAQEEERLRISRELHDETGQALTSLLVGLRACEEFRSLDEVRQHLAQMRAILKTAIDELRRIAEGLRPVVLDDLGLGPAIESHCRTVSKLHDIRIHTDLTALGTRELPLSAAISVYRIIQEAVGNVIKHARARQVWIRTENEAGHVLLTVRDDGRGVGRRGTPGLGITNIAERVALLDGTFQLKDIEEGGCELRIEIPAEARLRPSSAEDPTRARTS